jgi:nitrogen fixation NifU-like protein
MPAYSATVLDHFQNPRNLGEIDLPDAVAEVENPACGDRARLSLRIRDGRITEARFLAEGCPAAIAAASMTTVLLTGASLTQARALRDVDVAAALDGLPANKVHCSVLAEDVIREALDAYDAAVRSPRGGPATA